MEGMCDVPFEPRAVAFKIKQRVYSTDPNPQRKFIRKSCVRTLFNRDKEEESNDHHDSSHQSSAKILPELLSK